MANDHSENEKLSKTTNSMDEERLSDLAIVSIENDVVDLLEYDDIIDTFSAAKARKKTFE